MAIYRIRSGYKLNNRTHSYSTSVTVLKVKVQLTTSSYNRVAPSQMLRYSCTAGKLSPREGDYIVGSSLREETRAYGEDLVTFKSLYLSVQLYVRQCLGLTNTRKK